MLQRWANRAKDLLRKHKRNRELNSLNEADGNCWPASRNNPVDAVVEKEADNQLSQAIAKLPLQQRTIISLRLHGDLTFEQIAQQEGISCNTARSRYRYGLEKLRSSLCRGVKS